MSLTGDELPHIRVAPPGPQSQQLAARLARVESRNITRLQPPPIFWAEARGAAVRDVDDNIYIDLTAGFGVAHAGHANQAVASAIAQQATTLAHGLGDVQPPEPKLRLLERLAAIAPGELSISILGSSGAEAVEAALKTALMRTGRSGVIAFEGAYHGLTYGALSLTHRSDFRARFRAQLFNGVHFAPFPSADATAALAAVRRLIATAESSAHPIGAIVIEPILGRGGLVLPPEGFLSELRALCDGERTLLIFDEIYTGCGRTGRWFACEHEAVVPDMLVVGKALTGSIPLSAAIGTPAVMNAWPASTGEAIHTSTFLGNPIACAAALAQLDQIETHKLLDRALEIGQRIQRAARGWLSLQTVGPVRGRGVLQGLPLRDAGLALRVADRCLQSGVLVLSEGPAGDVIAITPPAVISDTQLDHALEILHAALVAESGEHA